MFSHCCQIYRNQSEVIGSVLSRGISGGQATCSSRIFLFFSRHRAVTRITFRMAWLP